MVVSEAAQPFRKIENRPRIYPPRTRGVLAPLHVAFWHGMADEGAHVEPWPWVLTDPLDDALDYSVYQRRRPALFPPLLEPKGGKGSKRRREEGPPTALQGERGEPLVENEPGLCARMEASHAALLRAIGPGGVCCAAWRLTASGATEPAGSTAAALLPPLAEPATAQRYARPLRRVEVSTSAVLRPPMLYSLVHNTAAHEVTVEALTLTLALALTPALTLTLNLALPLALALTLTRSRWRRSGRAGCSLRRVPSCSPTWRDGASCRGCAHQAATASSSPTLRGTPPLRRYTCSGHAYSG